MALGWFGCGRSEYAVCAPAGGSGRVGRGRMRIYAGGWLYIDCAPDGSIWANRCIWMLYKQNIYNDLIGDVISVCLVCCGADADAVARNEWRCARHAAKSVSEFRYQAAEE